MKKRTLGKMEVSAIGLGCMGMSHAYEAPADHKEMLDLVALAAISRWNFSRNKPHRTLRPSVRLSISQKMSIFVC